MYYLLLLILYPLALLPLQVLYLLSDFAFFILYRIIGYRRDVVEDNLRRAFPEKTEEEIKGISKKFYKSFCDQWIETLKLLAMSNAQLERRITVDWDVFNELYDEKRSGYFLMSHTFNWEWANVITQRRAKHLMVNMYLPPESKAFDRLMRRIRKGPGLLISVKAIKEGLKAIKPGQLYMMGLISDQNPSNLNKVIWLSFMGRTAPFFISSAQTARKDRAAIVFGTIMKKKRGYYHLHLQRFTEDASKHSAEEIMTSYVHYIEDAIREQPENWMWTHKRWKHIPPTATEQ
ncbi:MAG: hypothetical protein BGO70_01470 [Bacteroidetes bacterium 43-93]|nr:lysophospholipid acyltransferase family protein [Bacteroidota bacterium]OJW96377.1 MAG: hypothetical protein BGO70_01470 [Bacteroidetes bacterium 43-93]